MSDPAPQPMSSLWLRTYKRIWLWLAAALTIGCFAAAAYAKHKAFVILFSATGGSSLAFLYQGIMFRLFIGPRLRRSLPTHPD